MEPQKKINTKDKHFTLLGLTALNGDPVMCVIIFAGMQEQAVVETGMDVFADQEGEVSDEDFLLKIVVETKNSLVVRPVRFKEKISLV